MEENRVFESDLTEDRQINKFKLDEAWEEQAELSYKWGRKFAEAAKRRDDIIQERKVCRAELDTEYRMTYVESGMKYSETTIDAAIRQDDRHKEITRQLIEAEEEVAVYEAAKWAMNDRKKALEYESELWMAGYYGDPKQPQQKSTDIALRERMKTRREENRDAGNGR
jgi:hypothetical protein